ncbi:DUF6228 family protein [Ornithinimicrobium pekingense]|uniref:DUF317 domain-containing protein n=1 Tax=Ornithinimicrobium pekingense TaxID=384677 RepID=A0ABQ2FFS8_9MICO|nr:DUF6228 family protein [Ornithinimicrobium pekingense]GGK83682.1 hypothetical protein GCM10011509_35180 [Ornithinimicrobium pekingense]
MLQISEDGSAVALRWSNGGRHAQIELTSPKLRYHDPSPARLAINDMVEYTVALSGNGLSAEVLVLSLDKAGHGLPAFVEELAEDFRGWDGTRMWENADHDFGVEAEWTTRGHVDLRWWITPSIYDKWTASVVVQVEAGAEMSGLAHALASFFAI